MSEQITFAEMVKKAIRASQPEPRDAGAAALALTYARLMDEDPTREAVSDLGPKLLAVLKELALTPTSRRVPATTGQARGGMNGATTGAGGDGANRAAGTLAALRAAHGPHTRQHNPEDLDTTAA